MTMLRLSTPHCPVFVGVVPESEQTRMPTVLWVLPAVVAGVLVFLIVR